MRFASLRRPLERGWFELSETVMQRRLWLCGVAAALALGVSASASQAAPLGAGMNDGRALVSETSGVQTVRYYGDRYYYGYYDYPRRYRYHGYRYYRPDRYYYGYGPSYYYGYGPSYYYGYGPRF
jgi:hypothetical protein